MDSSYLTFRLQISCRMMDRDGMRALLRGRRFQVRNFKFMRKTERILARPTNALPSLFVLDEENEASFTEGCESMKLVPGDRVGLFCAIVSERGE